MKMEGEKEMEFEIGSYDEYKYLQHLTYKYLGIPHLDLTATTYLFV